MQSAPIPPDEAERVAKLRSYGILDTANEAEYEGIVRLVAAICRTPISNISFVDSDRQWFKAAAGLDDKQTPREIAFCAHTILGSELFVVPDSHLDQRFADNPLVTGSPGVRFYAGMPITTPDGYRLGSLCAIDRVPRELNAEQREALRTLSQHVVTLLELRARNRQLEELSELKSRLIAIMAHDVRSPLAAISSAVTLLQEHSDGFEYSAELFEDLHALMDSTNELVGNAIEWATRHVDGARFERAAIDVPTFAHELRESLRHEYHKKGNRLELQLQPGISPWSDRAVLTFVIRNMLVNANKFTPAGLVRLGITMEGAQLVITVADGGVGMNEERVRTLFDWSKRRSALGTSGERGSGLALLFSRDFITNMQGTISVESTPGAGTTFTVRVPASPDGR